MQSIPGAAMRGAPPSPTRVLCPECGTHMTSLPAGMRLARRGEQTTDRLIGTCTCGHPFDLPTAEEAARG